MYESAKNFAMNPGNPYVAAAFYGAVWAGIYVVMYQWVIHH
jgi:hypothetical protein